MCYINKEMIRIVGGYSAEHLSPVTQTASATVSFCLSVIIFLTSHFSCSNDFEETVKAPITVSLQGNTSSVLSHMTQKSRRKNLRS